MARRVAVRCCCCVPKNARKELRRRSSVSTRRSPRVLLTLAALVQAILVVVPFGQVSAYAVAREEPTRRDLAAFVLSYRDRMPREENTNAYRWGPESEGEVAKIIAALKLANRGKADSRRQAAIELKDFGYTLEWVEDTVTYRRFMVASEAEPCQRCWGLYILRYDSSSAPESVAVEVPHPFHDEFSPELGMELFRATDAKMFAMAGTHRYANGYKSKVSDMARSYKSVFHKVHTNFTTSRTHVVQVHGFTERPDYPNVVLSNGTSQPHAWLQTVASKLRASGVAAGVFDGQNYRDLGATVNPQGRHTNKKGGLFYHVESVYSLRSNPVKRLDLTNALADTILRNS